MTQTASSSVQAAFLQAVRGHQTGQLGEAERLYRQVLTQDSRHADALHMLGVLFTQTGRHAAAIDLIRQAISVNGGAAPFHANLGTALRHVGRLDDAAESYRRALAIKGDYADALNHLGTTLRDLDRRDEAEASYRKALGIKPDYADAHNNLGNLLRETHRLAEAEASYRTALRLTPPNHPKRAPYLRNLGTLLRDLGRPAEAEQAYQQALRCGGAADLELHHALGVVLRDRGALTDADLCFRRELAIAPETALAYAERAAVCRGLGRGDDAEALCGYALRIDPDLAAAHNCLGTLYHDQGRFDDSQAYLRRALAAEPSNAVFHFNMTATKRYAASDPHIQAMERLMEKAGSLRADDRVHLYFALAKVYDDIGKRNEGFDLLLEGNRLKRQSSFYDEAGTKAFFDRITELFSAEHIAALSRAAPADGPIFIVGMPRSGSTLVEQILASHPHAFGGGELPLFRQAITACFGRDGYPDAAARAMPADLDRLGRGYAAALQATAPMATRVTDKMLRNFLYCGLIHLALPGARIVHTRRDPVDCCLSNFSKLFVGDQPFSYDLAELGRYYSAYEAMMAHWRRVLPPGILIDVDYEQVVGDLEGQARRLLAHCGLAWDDACLSFHETRRAVQTASATQVRQPIYKSSVGRWRPGGDLLAPLLAALPDPRA